MTTLKRTFDLETRTLRSTEKCYVGQVYDHISTTLEFTYNPINALTTKGYTAYILFDLYDDEGNIFVFGPGSSPRFDGRTFEIPTSVTSRITGQRLEYQIWLIKNRLTWNGRIEELGDTEYLFSAKDALAFKPTTRCRSPSTDPCRPPQPCLEPGTLGWINYFRDHCVLTPIVEVQGTLSDGTEGVTLRMNTYNEGGDQNLELHVPYLDSEGLMDIHTFLRIVEEYNPDVTHDQIMTALCVQTLLDEKLDTASIVDSHKTPWADYKDTTAPMSARLARKNPIGPWDPEIEYNEDSLVIHMGIIFISQGSFNIGHEPSFWSPSEDQTEDFEWWTPIRGRSSSEGPVERDVSTYIEIVGPEEFDGYDEHYGMYAYKVYHHFNTSDLYVQARTNGSDREDGRSYTVNAIYDMSDHNSVRVLLSEPLDDDDIIVYISPGGGIEGEYAKQSYQALTYKDQPGGYAGLDRNAKLELEKLYSSQSISSEDDDGCLATIGAVREADTALREELEKKLDDTQLVQEMSRVEDEIPSTKLMGEQLDLKVDDTQIVQTLTRTEDEIPSTALLGTELDLKTDKVMAVPRWSPETEYRAGSTVVFSTASTLEEASASVYGGTVFISLADANIGNPPIVETETGLEYSEFWSMIKGEGGGSTDSGAPAQSYIVGNGKDREFLLTHNLGTKDVMAITRERATNKFVYPTYKARGFSATSVIFEEPPEANTYVVTIAPAPNRGTFEPLFERFSKTDTWTFNHNRSHIPMVQTFDSSNREIHGQVTFDSDAMSVTVRFNHAQTGTMVIR